MGVIDDGVAMMSLRSPGELPCYHVHTAMYGILLLHNMPYNVSISHNGLNVGYNHNMKLLTVV